MSVLRTTSPMTNSWSAPHKCTVRWESGVSGAPALALGEHVALGGVRRRAPGWSCSIHHLLDAPAPTSQRSRSAWSKGEGVQVEEKMSEKTEETATTEETKAAKKFTVTGRGTGTGTPAKGTTLTTETKQNKGDAETSALNLSYMWTDSTAVVPPDTNIKLTFSFSALSL